MAGGGGGGRVNAPGYSVRLSSGVVVEQSEFHLLRLYILDDAPHLFFETKSLKVCVLVVLVFRFLHVDSGRYL